MKKKNFVYIAFFIFLAAAHAHGASDRGIDIDRVKFGVHVRGGSASIWGVFGEYQVDKAVGIQAAILRFSDFYIMKSLDNVIGSNAFVTPRYIAVPLLFRIYPGNERQFCLYAGLQFNYLIGGLMGKSGEDESFETNLEDDVNVPGLLKKLKSSGSKLIDEDGIQKLTTHLIWGFDYEWRSGVQLGTTMGNGLSSLKECDTVIMNFIFKIGVGYNFARLLR